MSSRFKIRKTDLSPLLNPLTHDYLHNSDKVKTLFHYAPSSDSVKQAMSWKKQHYHHRQLLHDCLLKQYENVTGEKAAALLQIEKIKSEQTFTVTTGHQLNLFTGPLYFIYKIISAVKTAELLKAKFPECHFIPVYWMVSEDHDLAEINHFYLGNEKIEWNVHQTGAPCGRLSTNGLAELADRLSAHDSGNKNFLDLIDIFRQAYSSHQTLAGATRQIVHQLFGNKGLLILDADDAGLKKLLIPAMLDEIENHSAYRLVNQTISGIEKHYKAQVHPREINFFYLGNNLRDRIIKTGNEYATHASGFRFTPEELIKEIETHPEQFSPNVVTRPLYQEIILPNVAYVGGPAEIAYWLEYRTFFEHHQMHMPVLLLRDSFLWIDQSLASAIQKTGLLPEEFLDDENLLIRKVVKQKGYDDMGITEAAAQIEKTYAAIAEQFAAIDSTLEPSVKAEKQKVINGLKHLEDKLRKAISRKEETTLNRIRKIKAEIYPGGVFQERRDNLLEWYGKYGEAFFREIEQHSNSFEVKLKMIVEAV